MSWFMIGITCVYCFEMITCIIVLMAVIRDTFKCNRLQFNRSRRIYEERKQTLVSSFRKKTTTKISDIDPPTTETSFTLGHYITIASDTEHTPNLETKVRRKRPSIHIVQPLEQIAFEEITVSEAREVLHYEQTSPTSPVDIFHSSNSTVVRKSLSRFENNLKLFNELASDNNSDIKNLNTKYIDCIKDKRLYNNHDKKNKTMDNYKATPLDTILNQKKAMTDFETLMLTVNHVRLNTISTQFWKSIFLPVIDNKSSMLCRFLLTVISDEKTQTQQEYRMHLMNGLCHAMDKQDSDTSKIISWFITKICFLNLSYIVKKNVIDIWPATKCNCILDKKRLFCSKTIAIIVEMNTLCSESPNSFWEIDVQYICNGRVSNSECSKVHEHLQKSSSTIHSPNKISISGVDSKHLFDEHKNLSLICKSPLKSTGFKTNKHRIIQQSCIQLYCKKKGFIPIGENHLPRTFIGMQTDILDGSPRFLSHLRVGDQIGTDGYKRGTLGGFVQVRGDKAFLTCLHVFLNVDELASDNISLDDGKTVEVKLYRKNKRSIKCGKIRDIAFEVDNERETSIDAALIELQKTKIDNSDYVATGNGQLSFTDLGMKSEYLNDSWVDHKDLCFGLARPILQTASVGAENKERIIELESIEETYSKAILDEIKRIVEIVIKALGQIPIAIYPDDSIIRNCIERNCEPNISSEIKNIVSDVIRNIYPTMNCTSGVEIDRLIHEMVFCKTQSRFSAIIGRPHATGIP
ncbi:unnamed protein product [Mytilus coruscus]|uniref:Uncharacterized protein n=1 Tax=Mytilus coruscus TaxID=42192 RepID=A0A6J8ER50_MYTCO|nr:unnamed protein product [Mytilus coruscus]